MTDNRDLCAFLLEQFARDEQSARAMHELVTEQTAQLSASGRPPAGDQVGVFEAFEAQPGFGRLPDAVEGGEERECRPAPMEDILAAYELVRDVEPPAPVKLTRAQLEALPRTVSSRPHYGAYQAAALWGVPVEVVEDESDASSPPSGATYPQVASEGPQVGFLAKWINRIRRGR